jgi:putative colanic acid biosynthesis acetyltransferase WcaF
MNLVKPLALGNINKARRGAWNFVNLLLLRPSPRIAHGWRRMWLRVFGAQVGRGCLVYPSARVWAPWNLEIAEGAVIGDGAEIYNVAMVRLGRGAVVSQRAFLCTASHDYRCEDFKLIAGAITLGEGAWVAAEAFVGPGVELGAFAVLGARAVATRDVAPNVIAVGMPARPAGHRTTVVSPPGMVLAGLSVRDFESFEKAQPQ